MSSLRHSVCVECICSGVMPRTVFVQPAFAVHDHECHLCVSVAGCFCWPTSAKSDPSHCMLLASSEHGENYAHIVFVLFCCF